MLKSPDANLINDDIKPAEGEERHWSVLNMASLWIGMVVCVPTYMLAASMIGNGMAWWQAVLTVLLGNVIVLVPMVLNGHPGTKYGVPFPVLARASFGINGAHIPSLLRALVACGWFGIQTWIGGFAIFQLIDAMTASQLTELADLPILGINWIELVCFLLFWAVQVFIIYKGVEGIRLLETLAAPFLIFMGFALLIWAYVKAGGFGSMLSQPSQFVAGGPKEGQFWSVFFPSLTAMVGFWATLSLNIPDFTRYAKSQRDQVLGQAIGLPTTMTLFAFIGVAVTSATTVIYGAPVWDPVVLLGKMGGGFSVVISLFALSIATLSTNIAANVVSPANAMINVNPQKISFRMGGYVTAGLGIAMFPWKVLESSQGYIFTWLIGYSALLGPIGGILIADYFLLRKTELDLEGLYRNQGPYTYKRGFNLAAVLALVIAVLPNIPGFVNEATGANAGWAGSYQSDSVSLELEPTDGGFSAAITLNGDGSEVFFGPVTGWSEPQPTLVSPDSAWTLSRGDNALVLTTVDETHNLARQRRFFDNLYTYAWFVGFLLAGGLYLLFMKLIPHDSFTKVTVQAPAPTPPPEEAA